MSLVDIRIAIQVKDCQSSNEYRLFYFIFILSLRLNILLYDWSRLLSFFVPLILSSICVSFPRFNRDPSNHLLIFISIHILKGALSTLSSETSGPLIIHLIISLCLSSTQRRAHPWLARPLIPNLEVFVWILRLGIHGHRGHQASRFGAMPPKMAVAVRPWPQGLIARSRSRQSWTGCRNRWWRQAQISWGRDSTRNWDGKPWQDTTEIMVVWWSGQTRGGG